MSLRPLIFWVIVALLPALGGREAPTAAEALQSTLKSNIPPSVAPIKATFFPEKKETHYLTIVQNNSLVVNLSIQFSWSGQNCGTWEVYPPDTLSYYIISLRMIWHHPHPPCGADPAHGDALIRFYVEWDGGSIFCTYRGAASGEGPPCAADPPELQ